MSSVIVADRTEAFDRSYELVDTARNRADTMLAVGWWEPSTLPKIAANYRAAAAILLAAADAAEMDEDDGREALRALLARIEVED